jgi:hypothetical protein
MEISKSEWRKQRDEQEIIVRRSIYVVAFITGLCVSIIWNIISPK